jgi:hypothetical protein
MSGSRKTWLKALASRQKDAWLTAVRPQDHDGYSRVETTRTIYCFKDGACVEVLRRTYEPIDDTPFIGLRLVGWVDENDEYVSEWRPNARAVLWRPGAPGEETAVALTSPAFGFVRERFDDDEITLKTVRRGIARHTSPASLTRIMASA